MRKTYISPSVENINVYTDGIMKNVASVYNAGTGDGSEGPDQAGENYDGNVDVGAKHNTWGSLWEE